MAEKIIAHAAEAIILKEGDKVIKRRIKKGYRIDELDEKLRKLRTRGEAKLLEKAEKIISVPKLIKADEKTKEIDMEFINGKKLSENLDNLKNKFEIMEKAGEEVAKLHDNNIIHGDLTTSNMILVENSENNKTPKLNNKINNKDKSQLINNKTLYNNVISINNDNSENNNAKTPKLNKSINNKTSKQQDKPAPINNQINLSDDSKLIADKENFKVYIIDFGLGFSSGRIEDKAVDLHLIKQALEAKHFQNWEKLFESFLKGYNPKDKTRILEQLKKVEARGRYKH